MNTTKRMVQQALVARASRRVAKREARRRGQALLLAVLLMVFAALLGSTFITVVALNLSQSSRGESKQDAQNSALAGLRDANTQLQVSEQGEHWRPEQVNTPPFCGDGTTPADVECDTYYSPFEKAQGWARDVPPASSSDEKSGKWDDDDNKITQSDDWAKLEYFKKNNGKRVFVKFPDPRQLSGSNAQRPTYLVEVKPVTSGEKKDELQIDVIGRSTNSETAFYRTTTNKGTSTSGAPVAFALFNGNYNNETGKPLETDLVSSDTGNANSPSIIVKDARGILPGMTLLLQKGAGVTGAFDDVVVKDVDTSTGKIYLRTLRTSETSYVTTYTAGSKVRVVSTLMDGITSLDDDGDATTTAASTVEPKRSATDPATSDIKAVGAHINNGLVIKGNTVVALRPTAPDSNTPNRKDYLDVQGPVITSSGAKLLDASGSKPSVAMPSSSGDPNGANKIGSTGLSDVQLLVRDAVETDDPTQRGNSVRSMAPPSLDSSSERYLKLSKLADVEGGSAYGYGPGVFIDNKDDIEKVGVVVPATTPATAPAYRPLGVSDLQRFWQRKSFVAKETSITTPGTVAYEDDLAPNVNPGIYRGQDDQAHYRHDLSYKTPTAGSLEQRHVRGWISPTEFLPRGVLVELADNKIIITRDDRSDSSGSAPDEKKAWKDPQGNSKANLSTSPMSPRSYRMVLDLTTDTMTGLTEGKRSFGAPGSEVQVGSATPFNGLIYAEGNVRVRGNLNYNGKDITIVSMGNIYVEGGITTVASATGARDHVALLAKKNVVLNPTQLMPHVSGSQDRFERAAAAGVKVLAPATAGATQITVDRSTAFRVGDRLRVGADVTWMTVKSIDDVAQTLTLTSGLATATVTGDLVHVLGEPDLAADATAPGRYYYDLSNKEASLFTRDVQLGSKVEAHFLWLLHSGGRKFFNLEKSDNSGGNTPRQVMLKPDDGFNSTPPPPPAYLSVAKDNKLTKGEKRMFLTPTYGGNNFGPSGTDYIDLMDTVSYPTINSTSFRDFIEQPQPNGDKRWTMTDSSGGNVLPVAEPWRLANLFRAIYSAQGQKRPIPLTTSAVSFWSVGFDNLNLNPFATIIGTHPTDPNWEEQLDTSSEMFYQRPDAAGTGYTDAPVAWTNFPLVDAGGPYTGAVNSYADAANPLAGYHFAGFRINRDDYSANGDFKPAMDITVEASIFAQDGSWFVIPMPAMNFLDTDSNGVISPTEYQNSLSATEFMKLIDADGDGVVSDAEYSDPANANKIMLLAQAKAARLRRPGYKITIKGNIAQNVSPTSDRDYDDEKDPDGNANGAVQTWIDSLSRPTEVGTVGTNTNRVGVKYQSIEYQAAPLPPDNKLYMPVSPDLVYQG